MFRVNNKDTRTTPVAVAEPETLLKRDSGTRVFL